MVKNVQTLVKIGKLVNKLHRLQIDLVYDSLEVILDKEGIKRDYLKVCPDTLFIGTNNPKIREVLSFYDIPLIKLSNNLYQGFYTEFNKNGLFNPFLTPLKTNEGVKNEL